MALRRFTAGWLLQIRQVRCFDAKERHRSPATWWQEGVNVLETKFVEVSTREGEHRPVTLPRTCLKFPLFIPFTLCVLWTAVILLFVPGRCWPRNFCRPLTTSTTRQTSHARPVSSWLMYCRMHIIIERAKSDIKLSIVLWISKTKG